MISFFLELTSARTEAIMAMFAKVLFLIAISMTTLTEADEIDSKTSTGIQKKDNAVYKSTVRRNEMHSTYVSKKKPMAKSAVKQKKHQIPMGKGKREMPKDFIESFSQPNPMGHLSELLGIKGSFIPSEARQNWMDDDDHPSQAETITSERESQEMPETRSGSKDYRRKKLQSLKGVLPLDITPQQAEMITSTAGSNNQRQKFLKWEQHAGSMDLQHYPSTYIGGGKNHEGAREMSTFGESRKLAKIRNGPAYSRMKSEASSPKMESAKPKQQVPSAESYRNIGSEERNGYMGAVSDQITNSYDDVRNHEINNAISMVHGFMGKKVSNANDQPLTHDMIKNLQLDPAWDAMEANLLAEHRHHAAAMPVPESKIDREMMPPQDEPIGQAYLPDAQQLHHAAMVSNFHNIAGFDMQPVRPDMKASSYFAHYQPLLHHEPHTINVGGALGKSFFHRSRHTNAYKTDAIPSRYAIIKHRNYFRNRNRNFGKFMQSASRAYYLRPRQRLFRKQKFLSAVREFNNLNRGKVFDININELQ